MLNSKNQMKYIKILFSFQYILQYIFYVNIHAFQSRNWEIIFLIIVIIDAIISLYSIMKINYFSLNEIEKAYLYLNFIFIGNRFIADIYLLCYFLPHYKPIIDIHFLIIYFISLPCRTFAIIYLIMHKAISNKLTLLHCLLEFIPIISIIDVTILVVKYIDKQFKYKFIYIFLLILFLLLNIYVYVAQIIILS